MGASIRQETSRRAGHDVLGFGASDRSAAQLDGLVGAKAGAPDAHMTCGHHAARGRTARSGRSPCAPTSIASGFSLPKAAAS